MNKDLIPLFIFLFFSSLVYAQSRCTENVNLENIENYTFSLPSTRKITPYGDFIKTPNFPVNIAYNKKYIGVITSGATKERYFLLLDKNLCVLNKISFSPKDYDKGIKGDIYQGIYADKKGNFYIAGGSSDEIIKINFQNQNDYSIEKYKIDFKSFPKDQYPYYYQGKWEYGFKFYPNSVVADKGYIYATGLLSNALVRINQETKEKKYLNVGPYPYQVISDGNYLIVSLWGSDKIVVIDKKSFKKLYDIKMLPKGYSNKYPIHPSYMFAIKNSPYVLISDSNIDKILMVDIKDKKVVHVFDDKPFKKALQGSYPQGMDIYKNYLFVANAGNNDIAVFDLNSKKLLGFIPTGYYPTAIKVINDNLYVVSSKGLSSKPNTDHQWVGNMMKGTIQKIYIPKALEELDKLTNISLENNHFDKRFLSKLEKENKKAKKFLNKHIKYVVFILRENKTFDEELGTYTKAGKWADKNLALYSKKQLPNLFYDLKEGTLFANFMVDGEVTAQGHQWTTGANVSDFVEKTWQEYYTSRGLAENPGWTESLLPGKSTGWGGIPHSKEDPYAIYKDLKTLGKWSNPWISYPYRLYLFDELLRKNISFEDFGEFVSRDKLGNISNKMKKHLAIDYPGWDRMILDTYRAKYAINWLKTHKDKFPKFIYIWLPDDHTAGLNPCYYTPAYYVANNDYATQMIISYLSKTPQWKNMVVFITEDDAQSGEDHIDAHRTFAVAISPWVKRDYISTKPYSQVNIVRTIEAILNIKPLSQWDQTSFIFNDIWTDKPDYKPLKLLPIKEPIEFNPGKCDEYTLLRRYLGAKGLLPNSYWIKWFKKHKNELINKNGFSYKPNKEDLYTPTSLLKVSSEEQLKQEWIATKGIESYESLKKYLKNMKK